MSDLHRKWSRRLPVVLLACLVAPLIALGASAGARGGDGLEALQQVTHDACDCAAGQMSGLDAALRCTDGLQDFGRLKVAHRGAWDPADNFE